MSDSTPRLKIPELVSMQEANAATWNEALVQLDALVDLYLLGQYTNTPPGSPSDGDAYLIGGTPTGAWSGYAYKIASCIDGAWRFYTPFNGLKAYVATTGAFIVYAGGIWTSLSTNLSAAETSIASAATCDLGAAASLFVQITGTTTITSFGTGANKLCFVRFAQALTLTHNASSLILLGGASRTTAANDVGIYTSDASGNWRERDYRRSAADAGDLATKSGTETLSNKTLGTTTLPGTGIINSTGIGLGTTTLNAPLTITNSTAGAWFNGNSAGYSFFNIINSANTSGQRGYRWSFDSNRLTFQSTTDAGAWQANQIAIWQSNGLTDIAGSLRVGANNISGTSPPSLSAALVVAGAVFPNSDNSANLGSASYRWGTVYAATGTINTSGAATKQAIRALSEAEIAAAKALAANVRIFQFCDAVAKKGEAARLHTGMIYEDVAAAFTAQGLDAEHYGILCRDADESDPQKSLLGLRTDELAQFVMAGLAARLAALEAK